MLQKVNHLLEKAMPFITPTGLIAGVLLAGHLNTYVFLVPWIFAFITFTGSLGSNFSSLKRVTSNPVPILVVLGLLHIVMPIWAWLLGHLVFPGDDLTITGLVLGVVIPTGVTSLLWVSIYKGSTLLTLTIVLIDTLLSPILVPYSVAFFSGATVEMNTGAIMKGLIGMIVLPSLLGMLLNQLTRGKIKPLLGPRLAPFSKLSLGICVTLNSVKVADYLNHIDAKLITMAILVFFIAFSGYLLSWMAGRCLKWEKEDIIAVTYTGGMRNIAAGAALAVAYFPAAVAVPVILGTLFQQILASVYGSFLNRHYHKPKSVQEDKLAA
ncbi:bile acid:sodium symporter family protein [Peribacillus sp. SI8-4]|uniref:bile acid:sodium symporter family protein n=1 Tax=Peribacillus sp. SI8-4 TaxID=3048009 RepID=UPI0025557E0C|nr:bile acid:sodium symporter family protein [Peribacillus sp. SI8-4]